MPIFDYVAKDKAGKIHRGSAEAVDEEALEKQLRDSGYWLTQASISIPPAANASTSASDIDMENAATERAKLIYLVVGTIIIIALFVFSLGR